MHVKWREDLKFISEGLEPLLAVDQAGAHLKRSHTIRGSPGATPTTVGAAGGSTH